MWFKSPKWDLRNRYMWFKSPKWDLRNRYMWFKSPKWDLRNQYMWFKSPKWDLRNRYMWFKSPKWDFWFPRSWKKRGFFLGARIRHFAKRGPSDIVKELFGYFQKNRHISRKKFMKWPSFLAITIILGRFGSFLLIKLSYLANRF
jgi:hypothetical protein